MKNLFRSIPAAWWVFALIASLLCGFAIAGIEQVPFHPDESTQLYTSQDFDLLISAPGAMAWHPDTTQHLWETDRRLYYRLMDAPLTRYLLGLARGLAGLPAPQQDWEWSQTWGENQARGALPPAQLLKTGRGMITLLLPISLLSIYLLARQMSSPLQGWLAMLLLGTNALILLHARRSMAEGALVATTLLAMWSFLQADRRPWLAGLAAALAFNAKHSALLLFPVGLLAVCWVTERERFSLRRTFVAAAQYGCTFALVTLALNPFLWRYPLQAAQATLQARQSLAARQVADAERLSPGSTPDTVGERMIAEMINLYFTPPAFAEYGNYQLETVASQQNYLQIPGNNLLRGLAGGGFLLGLTLAGVLLGLVQLRHANSNHRRTLGLLLITTLALFVGLGILVPLPWQRYILPLVPLSILWQSYLITRLATTIAGGRQSQVETVATERFS